MTLRIITLVVLILLGYFTPIWLFAIGSAFYALYWKSGAEPLIIAVLIDVQFGSTAFPWGYLYTLSVGVLVIATFFIRPYMRTYA